MNDERRVKSEVGGITEGAPGATGVMTPTSGQSGEVLNIYHLILGLLLCVSANLLDLSV
jgi:hypothetical protein